LTAFTQKDEISVYDSCILNVTNAELAAHCNTNEFVGWLRVNPADINFSFKVEFTFLYSLLQNT